MIEIWRNINEWEGYLISNTGKVKKGEKLVSLSPNKNRNNYVYVYHHNTSHKPRALSVHRLVARYFIPNPINKPCVNHIDNDTQNNCMSNLEWVTHKENIAHTIKQGRKVQFVGVACPQAKLTEETVRSIKNHKGILSYVKIAEKFNTNYSNVAHIMRGTRWGHLWKR